MKIQDANKHRTQKSPNQPTTPSKLNPEPNNSNEQSYLKTYLLTVDPARHHFERFKEYVFEVQQKGSCIMSWSVGNSGISKGDQVFFMRHGNDNPGLIGSGHVISDTWVDKHWDSNSPKDWQSTYADIQWDYLNESPLITLTDLIRKFGLKDLWTKNGSGHLIPDETADRLERFWANLLKTNKKPIVEVEPGADPKFFVSRFLADNPGASVEDLLDIKKEVTAFAQLAAARKVFPPLSIGIFGEWGSGKTFFMDRMHVEVDKLACSGAHNEFFHSNIVQIRFNAWHYIESNLWASLVDAIFLDLDRWLRGQHKDVEKLFDQLTTSKQLRLEAVMDLIEVRKRKQAAENSLCEAMRLHQEALEAKISSPIPDIWSSAAATFTKSLTNEDREKLEKAGDELGLPQLQASATALAQVVKDCHSESQRARLLGNSLLHRFGSTKYLLAAVATILLIPFSLEALRVCLSSNGFPWLRNINASVLGLASVISTITAVLGYALKSGRRALNVFENFCQELENAVADGTAEQRQAMADAEKKLAEQAQKVAEAERLLASATDEAAVAERNYENDTARGRLNRFIRERVADGTYANHLGLIATIRKDFAQLAEIMNKDGLDTSMTKELKAAREAYQQRLNKLLSENVGILTKDEEIELQNEVPVSELRHFERIVLYIDDLDRCPPDKVADVLQAIHMFLFFPLFVVVVAVDARWVTRSLETEFPHLLSGGRRADDTYGYGNIPSRVEKEKPPATALDYLEKIFQIPFWVRPMTEGASKNFIAGLTKGWITGPNDRIPPEPQPEGATGGVGRPEVTHFDREQTPLFSRAVTEDIKLGSTEDLDLSEAGSKTKPSEVFDSMTLTLAEAELLKSFARFLGGSPRRAKRFVNLYLLIKTSLGTGLPNPTPNLPTINDLALVILLTVVTGTPHVCKAFFTALPAMDADQCDIETLLQNLVFDPEGYRPLEEDTLRLIIQSQLASGGPIGREMIEALHAFAPTVQRYSFQGNVGILERKHHQNEMAALTMSSIPS